MKHKTPLGLALVACAINPWAHLMASAPDNDDFSSPIVVSTFPSSTTATNVEATLEPGEEPPFGYGDSSVWFVWTSAASGPVQIDTFGSSFDTILGIWTGSSLDALSEVSINDDSDDTLQSAISLDAASGTTYRIAVCGIGSSGQGSILLNIGPDLTSHIAGRVTAPDGTTPLGGIWVAAHQWDEEHEYWGSVQGTETATDGTYGLQRLRAGTYRMTFQPPSESAYMSETYNDVPGLAPDSGDDIVLAAATTLSNVDASLAIGSGISGTVTGPDGSTPLGSIGVQAFRWDASNEVWVFAGSTSTAQDGTYSLLQVPADTYRVEFFSKWCPGEFCYFYHRGGDYAFEVFADADNVTTGVDIEVPPASTVTGINASMQLASRIEGTVTGPNGTTPLESIWVMAFQWDPRLETYWRLVSDDFTAADGTYVLSGLRGGVYRVTFNAPQGTPEYGAEAYDGALNLWTADDVAVGPVSTITGIDASLPLAGEEVFTTWIARFNVGGQTGFGEDPDSDNLDSGLENFLGFKPNSANGSALLFPRTVHNEGDVRLILVHPQNPSHATDLAASYEWSNDMIHWHASGDTVDGATVTITTDMYLLGTTVVTASVAGDIPDQVFVRLRVTQSP